MRRPPGGIRTPLSLLGCKKKGRIPLGEAALFFACRAGRVADQLFLITT
jgi:hypothetical protein